jgi:hypothetical protein
VPGRKGQLAGDDASQAPLGVASAFALGRSAGHVGAGVGIDAQAHQQDGVQRAVELPVTAPVEPVAGHLPGGGRDGVGAASAANSPGPRAVLAWIYRAHRWHDALTLVRDLFLPLGLAPIR